MTLLQIRQKFVELSGRYDLVVSPTTFTPDNGANFFIQAGQRFLDNLHEKQLAWYKKNLAVGDAVVDVQYAKSIKEVWVMNSDGRVQLDKVDYGWLRENYSKPVASLTQGDPLYYAVGVNKLSPGQIALTTGAGASPYTAQFTYGHEDLIFANELSEGYLYTTVLIAPPTDEVKTIEILGQFFSLPLSTDTQVNFWSEQYPELLLKAALYELECFYRNTEGARDWYNAIDLGLLGLDKNQVDEEMTDIDQREG